MIRELDELASRRVVLFGGKGGVGKTTISAAAALHYAKTRPVILFTTDPASNLSDLGLPLRIESLDAHALYDRFLGEHLDAFLEIGDRGTYLDREELRRFFELSLPGIDELMAWMHVGELAEEHPESLIVVDTAPTGHTLRMLSAGGHFRQLAVALDAMQEKHRTMVRQFTRRDVRDRMDAFIDEFDARAGRRRELLRDPARAAFVPVMLSEPWVVEQTERLIDEVEIDVPFVVLNRAVLDVDCDLCRVRAARDGAARERFARVVDAPRSCVPLDSAERLEEWSAAAPSVTKSAPSVTKGAAAPPVTKSAVVPPVAKTAAAPPVTKTAVAPPVTKTGAAPPVTKTAVAPPVIPSVVEGSGRAGWRAERSHPPDPSTPHGMTGSAHGMTGSALGMTGSADGLDHRMLFLAGKGGVGKTTCAAAIALRLARRHPDQRFTVISVDPAHSLRDVFASERPPGNLAVEIIDTRAKWQRFRDSIGTQIEDAVDALTPRGFTVAHDSEAMKKLVEIAPPGADELFAITRLSELAVDDTQAAVIVDTAPTGHFLRLLDLPAVAGEWVREFMRLLLHYRDLVPPGSLGEELVNASRALKALEETLHSRGTAVLVVTRPERIVVAETRRLIENLEGRGIAVGGVIANYLTPDNDCPCDRSLRSYELAELHDLDVVAAIERRDEPVTRLDELADLVPLY